MKNVYVQLSATGKIHTALHKSFDEAFMTEPEAPLPPMALALQKAGYSNINTTPNDKVEKKPENFLKLKLLTPDAITPTRSSTSSAGLDLYSTIDGVVRSQENLIIPIDIAIEPEEGTYAQIATRSSIATKGVSVLGGVIDSDYRGNVKVILHNNSKKEFHIQKGQRVAQLLVKHISLPTVQVVNSLSNTVQSDKGFGSTEMEKHSLVAKPGVPRVIPLETMPLSHTAAAAATATVTENINENIIEFDDNPFDNVMDIVIENSGDHPTRGITTELDENFEKLRLIACDKNTPAGKIPRGRSTLRGGLLLHFNEIPIMDKKH